MKNIVFVLFVITSFLCGCAKLEITNKYEITPLNNKPSVRIKNIDDKFKRIYRKDGTYYYYYNMVGVSDYIDWRNDFFEHYMFNEHADYVVEFDWQDRKKSKVEISCSLLLKIKSKKTGVVINKIIENISYTYNPYHSTSCPYSSILSIIHENKDSIISNIMHEIKQFEERRK